MEIGERLEKKINERNPENPGKPIYLDLSHTIQDGLVTYKGLPPPLICDYLSREASKKIYEPGTEFQIGKIEMVSNTGTYIDTPFHRYSHGKDLSEIGLESLVDLEAEMIHIPFKEGLEIGLDAFLNLELKGKALLIHTGWDIHWNTESYYENHPYLNRESAEFLKNSGVILVGIDSHNIDNTRGISRPVHTLLLGSNILIVEHLTGLEQIPPGPFTFTALPPKFKGVGTFPVRAIAQTKSSHTKGPFDSIWEKRKNFLKKNASRFFYLSIALLIISWEMSGFLKLFHLGGSFIFGLFTLFLLPISLGFLIFWLDQKNKNP
jgi:kynurenine formamidase